VATARLKQGTTLLEVRRIEFCSLPTPTRHNDNDYNDDDNKEGSRARPRPHPPAGCHQETTVLVSRGMPGLGGSVSSTCLDFCPHLKGGRVNIALFLLSLSSLFSRYSYSMASPVGCATELTTRALCIHSLHNLNEDVGGGDGCTPSSTVEYYAPRQQRPATLVAWRPAGGGGGNLIAVGLSRSTGLPGEGAVGAGAREAGRHQHLQ
jgi:hypothetical protein